ncbi:MAG: BatD family protein [Verrucomicrobiota bacterium]
MVLPLLALAFLSTFAAPSARAQSQSAPSVRWEVADQGMMSAAIQLVFENCTPDGDPNIPQIPNVALQFAGSSNNTSIVNFQMTQSVLLVYMVRSRSNAPVQIPSFDVKTSKGVMRVAAFSLAAPTTTVDAVASAKFVPERTSVWVGEVFGLLYELSASRRNNPQINPTFDWNAAPLVAEDWSKYEFSERVVNNERRAFVTFRTRVLAKNAGSLKLEAATHLLSIQTGSIASFFGPQARMEQVAVTSDQPVIDVKPLPTPPSGYNAFNGAVGQFKLVSKIVPEKASVGEPVTWTLELTGTGNWPDVAGLPARNVSNDFRVVQPKAKRTPAEGKLFEVSLAEDVVLVPTKPGAYTLGPVEFVYFDPKTGTYQKQTVAPVTLAITAPAASQFSLTPTPAPTEPAAAAESTTKTGTPPKAPPPPAGIPRDPLPGAASVSTPLTRTALVLWLAAPFAALLGFWFWLAVRRAQVTDPVRPRREARDRLADTLSHLPAAGEAERAQLLLAWQRDTRVLWQIYHAAPPASALKDTAWITLWNEADRALYGAKNALPSDWVARAQEALAAKRVPGFRPLRLFLPQNLMPFAAALALLFAATSVVLEAAELDAVASYRKGEFAAAEKSWRATLAQTPTNWIARHNLSLALAQQDRAPESAAHAVTAIVQNPSEPAVRWHFGQSAERSGFAAPQLAAFINPGPRQSLARLASPAQWQRILIASAFLAALAIGLLLASAYSRRRSALALIAGGLLIVTLAAGASGIISLVTYGLAANPNAVIIARGGTLRSIPTEADTAQKTTPLAPGSLALADKTFLDGRWIRLAFENGQTGWVRKDDIVQLWR